MQVLTGSSFDCGQFETLEVGAGIGLEFNTVHATHPAIHAFRCVVRRDYVVESHLGGKKSSRCSRGCECHCYLLLRVQVLLFFPYGVADL